MAIIIFFVCLGVGVLFFFDFFLHLREWLSRIYIGRWNERDKWKHAVEKKSLKWLRGMPLVPRTDERRLVLVDILRGDYYTSTIQSWQIAGLLLGVSQDYIQKYAKKHSNLFISENIIELDQLLLAYALKKANVLTPFQEANITNSLNKVCSLEETLPYKSFIPQLRFVDTIGLACPWFSLIGKDDLVEKQFNEYETVLFEGVVPPHAFDKRNGKPLGLLDWSRGIGWYALGLVLTKRTENNKTRIIHLANYLLPYQKPTGGFGWMVFSPDAPYESSGTAMIGLLFVEAYVITGDEKYLQAAQKAEIALMKATRRDGSIDYNQGDTHGIGHYSSKFGIMPFSQGITLFLSHKIDLLIEKND